jgi:hypothetical protein
MERHLQHRERMEAIEQRRREAVERQHRENLYFRALLFIWGAFLADAAGERPQTRYEQNGFPKRSIHRRLGDVEMLLGGVGWG